VTVCVLLLDLVVALAKLFLVLVFSVEDPLIQAHSLSWQPSLRAFHWQSFMKSSLYQAQHICSLVRSENPFLTAPSHMMKTTAIGRSTGQGWPSWTPHLCTHFSVFPSALVSTSPLSQYQHACIGLMPSVCEALYCITQLWIDISLPERTPHTWMMMSLSMCGTVFYNLWHPCSHLLLFTLVQSFHFCPDCFCLSWPPVEKNTLGWFPGSLAIIHSLTTLAWPWHLSLWRKCGGCGGRERQ